MAEYPTESELPREYVHSLQSLGERGAARVATFLRAFGLQLSRDRPLQLPAELLIGLDLALRFWAWERSAITAHTDAGLPTANQVLNQVLSLMQGPELHDYVDELGLRATAIQREQLIWQAGGELGADVAINPGEDEEAFLEAMAGFLWTHRGQLTPTKETP